MKGEIPVMTGKLKKLKVYGIMYFIFGVAGAINLLVGALAGKYNAMGLVDSGLMGETLATMFMGVEFLVSVVVILAFFCMGLKGYVYGIGEGFGYIHVSVSRYLPVFLVLQIAMSVFMVFSGRIDYVPLISSVIGLVFVFSYNRCARVALES